MIFSRALSKTISRYAKFPIIGVFGPRQSGKTTLVKTFFDKHAYVNFEDPQIRAFALEDPKGFLDTYANDHGIILDEFQYVPGILSYIQIESDAKDRPGYFVLTGSQNFLMNEAITQSLAGRIGILTLLPLSIQECAANNLLSERAEEFICKGGYPRLYAKDISPLDLYPSYIHSYIERDIRQLVNVENLDTFQKFMQLCAGRVGQLLNISDLAVNCGISQKTVHSWLSILEASYILFLLKPYHGNFNKRVTKSPKLYFYDTGVACSLLNIRSPQELALSTFKGPLFECAIIADLFKQYFNKGLQPPLYFWRDTNDRLEVDCVVDLATRQVPIEFKSSQTASSSFFSGINTWSVLAGMAPADGYVVYAGQETQKRSMGTLVGWKKAGSLIDKIETTKKI